MKTVTVLKTATVLKIRNIRLTVEYDGTAYSGWQKQIQFETVQGTLEEKLKQVCGHLVDLLVAGRTDSGVHALGQTANFHTSSTLPIAKIQDVLNHLLPRDIHVVKVQEVPETFHATYHAKAKLYRYVIRNTKDYTVFDRNTYHHVRTTLDITAMKKAAKFLIGTHDFTAFRGTLGKWANPKRTITQIKIQKKGDEIILEYMGVSFLHQMIRILSGTLLYVGLGKLKPGDMKEILKSKDRKKAGPTLPPNGLFLVKVYYPATFPKVKKWKKKEEE
ncbi:MAG TPA: tRNA pseudouridine(38-40) synthase TruA [bacterium]|nr:tRNA pseudouridine(38-40) synthase TruA [bacterium]